MYLSLPGARGSNDRLEGDMLKLDISGDEHPKTVKLVTDDREAELDQIGRILDDTGTDEGDPFRQWFDNATADELAEGVQIPQEHLGEWFDLLEDFSGVAEQIDALRRDAEGVASRAAGSSE